MTRPRNFGWLPDYPSLSDYTPDTDAVGARLKAAGQPSVKAMLVRAGAVGAIATLPPSVDLRRWCSPIEAQGNLGSCTAHAGVGLSEYFQRKAFGKHIEGSRRFLYWATRKLAGITGDNGGYLRSAMEAMATFGVPPEKYWLYTTTKPNFDYTPPAFVFALAQNYQALQYYRLDPRASGPAEVLGRVKTNLAAQLPCMFGFTLYQSYVRARDAGSLGKIPLPAAGESVVSGHAVVAVGYDDAKAMPGTAAKGALLIRNSWGTVWGEAGYGWLPYEYVTKGLAKDFWSMLQAEWLDSGQFGPNA